jgi:hypothetical protein
MMSAGRGITIPAGVDLKSTMPNVQRPHVPWEVHRMRGAVVSRACFA